MLRISATKLIRTSFPLIRKSLRRCLKAKTLSRFSSKISISANPRNTSRRISGTQSASLLPNSPNTERKPTVTRARNRITKRPIRRGIIVEAMVEETITKERAITGIIVSETTGKGILREGMIIVGDSRRHVRKGMSVIIDELLLRNFGEPICLTILPFIRGTFYF